MRLHIHRKVAAASAGVALLGVAPLARAQQLDTNPPAPNVLLLLDTSGSMERMIDGKTPEAEGQPCNYDLTGKAITANAAPTPNRWGTVIQALTGNWTNATYNCVDMPRTQGGQFKKEYQIGGVSPYDTGYYLDYHRPVMLDPSTSPPTACVVAPGALPGALTGAGVGVNGAGSGGNGAGNGQSALDFPSDAVILRPFTTPTVAANPATGPCSQFPTTQYQTYQYPDGAIPTMTSLMRFGLMTFDQDPSPSTGVTGTNPNVVGGGFVDPLSTFSGAFAGMWSYFPGWNTGQTCTYFGNPPNCNTSSLLAVGARNPAAPPWEGRMIPFPVNDNTLGTQEKYNSRVSNVVLASRPYGATPLAGLLQAAEYYYWRDPNGPQKQDPYVTCGDRPQYIIILTDGAPNLDMRPDCSMPGAPPGSCPFELPETLAGEMNAPTGGQTPITTYVIGFAVSSATIDSQLEQCATLAQNGVLDATCNTPPPAGTTLDTAGQACCQLQRIALKGSQNLVQNGLTRTNPNPQPAFFADTPGALQNALSTILSNIAHNATTRTPPAFGGSASGLAVNLNAGGSGTTTIGAEYLPSFNLSPGLPLTGDLTRKRDVCQQPGGSSTFTTNFASVDKTKGDDFATNLNSNLNNPRTFIAFQPAVKSDGSVDASATIRPYVTTDRDGFGNYSATTYRGDANTITTGITPTALKVTSTSCPYNAKVTDIPQPPLTAAGCAAMNLAFAFAQPSFNGEPGNYPFFSRFGNAEFGGIWHASPAIVGPPNTLLQDPGYSAFQIAWQSRESVAYVATSDGLLHAFWTDETIQENNERWAMLLPAVMPKLNPPKVTPATLLDGTPIVKDVAWDRSLTSSPDGTIWHTMLVASFGPNNTGYYALDVTDPNASSDLAAGPALPPDNPLAGAPPTAPTSGPPVGTGPHLRWQLTTVPPGNFPIFGSHSATPAITTLFMDPGDGNGAREIAVAILPGGSNGPPSTSTSCARLAKSGDSQPVGAYQYRTNVQCWGGSTPPQASDPVAGRSVAIVRVDTGEILQVFERTADALAYPSDTLYAKHRINNTPLDSPMTGTPLVYPTDVGTDATKIFISDADGTIWKFDVSDPSPVNWKGTIFLDLYNQTVDTNTTSWADGQPLTVTPTLSTDTSGNVVINAATGVTDTFDANGIQFIYSITEKVQGTGTTSQQLRAFVNWYLGTTLTPGAPGSGTQMPASQETAPTSPPLQPGERVSGPMVVFNGTLYFATYIVPTTSLGVPTVQQCIGSSARVWGVDFVTPFDGNCTGTGGSCNRALGGKAELMLDPMTTVLDFNPFATVSGNSALSTAVIPGVGISAPGACAGFGNSTNDQYVGGAQHFTPQGLGTGSYALSFQAGAPAANGAGGTSTKDITIPSPLAPTMIDSWAAVVE